MFSKSNLLATLVGGLFLFLGGYLIWGVLTVDFFAQHAGSATGVHKESPEMVYLAIGCLLEAFFMSSIYGKWARSKKSARKSVATNRSQNTHFWVAAVITALPGRPN